MSLDPALSMALSVQAHKGIYAVLLGSGISRSAGIPTGWEVVADMIGRLAVLHGEDSGADRFLWYKTKFNKEPSYSELLALLAPKPAERMSLLREYFEPTKDDLEQGRKVPTAAHHALARLVAGGYVRVIVTTNFDRLAERAIEAAGISPVVVSSPDQISGMMPLAHVQCAIIKIHGDYLDTRIRNTPDELCSYDTYSNTLLDQIFSEYGLVVCGWSADWDVALAAAVMRNTRFRFSTYWMARGKVSVVADKVIKHRQAVLVPILGADAAFADLEAKVQALENRCLANPTSTKVAVAMMKRFLSDDRYRIQLNDFVMEELGAVRRAVSIKVMPVSDPAPDATSYPMRLQQMEVACSKLAAMVATGVYWGTPKLDELWRKCLETLTRNPIPSGRLFSPWKNLHLFPMNLVAYSAGIAAICSKRYEVFQTLFAQSISRDDRYEESMISAIGTARCFDHDLAQSLHSPSPNGATKRTPGSDWLITRLPTLLQDIVGDEVDFENLYDEFDMIISLISIDMGFGLNFARYTWRRFHRGDKDRFIVKLREDINAQGGKQPLLAAGLFNGDPKQLSQAIEAFVKDASRASW